MTSSNTSTTMPESQSDETELPAETHHTTSSQSNEIHSGVGVLDKTVKILDALESGPATLGQLVSSTGLARPTAHRLAIALERHRFVLRDQHGRFVLGSRFAELAAAASNCANPSMDSFADRSRADFADVAGSHWRIRADLPPSGRYARVHRRRGARFRFA